MQPSITISHTESMYQKHLSQNLTRSKSIGVQIDESVYLLVEPDVGHIFQTDIE